MASIKRKHWLLLAGLGFSASLLLPIAVWAQEEVTSAIRRYKQHEASTGYYEEYEAKPRHERPLVSVPGVREGIFPYSPFGAEVRNRSRLADSHSGIKFYERRRCEECHIAETTDSHMVRGNVTCRQCHGGEPIASINHYYSPMNPIRKHAYVCSKCHEGSNASFASFLVHEPYAGAPATRKTFPLLYFANWFMYLLIVGVMGFFIIHTIIWLGKEGFLKVGRKKPQNEK